MKIKLTESKLKQIVAESVKNILTELDWKTYANAARKEKDPDRAKKFRERAAEIFNQEFGYNGDDEFARTKISNDTLSLGHRYKKDDDSQVFFSTHLDPSYENTPTNYGEVEPYGSKTHGYVKRPFTNNKAHARAMQKSQDAFNAYRTGKSKYVKGTGWDDSEHTPTDWQEYMDYNN
jgi:hypothetical protein